VAKWKILSLITECYSCFRGGDNWKGDQIDVRVRN